MATERPWFVLLSPVGATVSDQLVDELLAFLFCGALGHLLTHTYFSNPACRRILLSVPVGRSSDILPGTVTLPGLVACLNCRWLPFWDTWTQPSLSNSRTTSRTFMPCLVPSLVPPSD